MAYAVILILGSIEQWSRIAPEFARFARSMHYCPATGIGRNSIRSILTTAKGIVPSLLEYLIERRDRAILTLAFADDLTAANAIVDCATAAVGDLSLPGNGVACILSAEYL